MKHIRLLTTLLYCILTVGMQAQTTHWTCDSHAYQYDMAVYLGLNVNGTIASNLSNYEIAAFCGNECRGVAKIQSAVNKQYGYIRIRSNATEGETVTFKVYDKTKQKEFDVKDKTLPFKADTSVGVPSNPFVLSVVTYTLGDVNDDGNIDTQDAIMIIQHYLGKKPDGFNPDAADVSGDGRIDTQDAIRIIRRYLNKQ